MYDYKSVLASKTVWGGIIALAAGAAGIFGYTVSAQDQATLIEVGTAVASSVGGIVAIWGRIVASKKIG